MRSRQWLHAIHASTLVIVVLAVAGRLSAAANLHTYFVGNSLTGQINPAGVNATISARGESLTFGYNVHTARRFNKFWTNPTDGFAVDPYGFYGNALPNYQWDAVSLQPFNQTIEGANGDRAYASSFINLARTASPNAQFYLYSQWPLVDASDQLDFNNRWNATYSGQLDDTIRSRDYYQQLLNVLRQDYSSLAKPILLVPVGDVMYELNQRMHAGQVPGFTDIRQFYVDGTHLTQPGSYMIGMTFYATLFKEDPRGLGGYDPYGITDPAVAAQIQDAVWQVVTANPSLTGVPEPATALSAAVVVLIGSAIGRRRHQVA